MSAVFFAIASQDLTDAVDIQNFDVNEEPVYTSWTDINGTEHRDYIRTRIEGRFTLGFSDATAFASAVSTIQTALATTGHAQIQIFVNNDGTTHIADCYLEITGAAKWDFTNLRQWQTLEVRVFER